jgi:hypothetical protein
MVKKPSKSVSQIIAEFKEKDDIEKEMILKKKGRNNEIITKHGEKINLD